MSSREWLLKHSLRARKLLFYDILATVAFKHQDGVVDLQFPPGNEIFQTDAVSSFSTHLADALIYTFRLLMFIQ